MTETNTPTPEELSVTIAAMNRLGKGRLRELKLRRQGVDYNSFARVRFELRTLAFGNAYENRSSRREFDKTTERRRLSRKDFKVAQTVYDALAATGRVPGEPHDAMSQALERRSQPIEVNLLDASLLAAGTSVALGSALAVAEQSTPACIGGLAGGVLCMTISGADYLRRRRHQGRHTKKKH